MHILGIIPARGGSKVVPRKNLVPLIEKPLIAFTIEEARKVSSITRLIVSTDDSEIAMTSRQYGAETPFLRPESLAADDTPVAPVACHAVRFFEERENWSPDAIMVLQPTSPLRTSQDIEGAVNRFVRLRPDTLVSVCTVREHPAWMWQPYGDFLVPYSGWDFQEKGRQSLPVLYRETGAIYLVAKEVLMKRQSLYGSRILAYETDAQSAVDINDEHDFQLAEYLLRRKANGCGENR